MAREERAKIKMTVIHFETESDSTTLQENVRAIAQTLNRALTSPQRTITTASQNSSVNDQTLDQALEIDPESRVDQDDFTSSATSSKKKNANRQYRTPQPVELDLTSGELPLKNFLDQKQPDTDIKKYLTITHWLKQHRNIQEVTMDHVYTCYRHMGTGWQVPADAGAPLRAMKGKQYAWMKTGTAKGAYIINHLGENEVQKMGN
jgi:hypothetical protein